MPSIPSHADLLSLYPRILLLGENPPQGKGSSPPLIQFAMTMFVFFTGFAPARLVTTHFSAFTHNGLLRCRRSNISGRLFTFHGSHLRLHTLSLTTCLFSALLL